VDNAQLNKMRLEREKEVKMWDIVQEIMAYSMFLWLLLVLSYGNRDPNATYLRQGIYDSFRISREPANFSTLLTGRPFPKDHRDSYEDVRRRSDLNSSISHHIIARCLAKAC
jgi:hypothetical protein